MGLRRGKKSKETQPATPAANLPPLGAVPAPLPAPLPIPAPGAPLPLPNAPSLPLPAPLPNPHPLPAPAPSTPELPLPVAPSPATSLSAKAEEKGYNELWAKRSDKPLQQIYGHIDRISNKEAGSLLDRYADRFGHSLDREIIVMRKAAVDEKVAELRDAPTVELIDDEPTNDVSDLERVEAELRSLKPLYQEAKALGDKAALAELTPTLQALMAQRKALKSSSNPTLATASPASVDEGDAVFERFVTIVDDLLGEHLPASVVDEFVSSPGFDVYRNVLESPTAMDETTRGQFYNMVDDLLGNMSESSIDAFVASSEFEIYRLVGEQYKDA